MTAERPIRLIDAHARRGGFTLLEGLVASVILAILVLGVVSVVTAAYQQSQSVRATATSVTLARQLSDEIVSKPFNSGDTLGAGSMTSRSQFTGISNYNGYSDNSTGMPLLEGGTLDVTGEDTYTRSVSVTVGAAPSNFSASTNFAIVTVNVTAPDGEVVSIPEFVAQYSLPRQ
jgi:prepilin-type N-terminal cleavage/methylation domain-containing protein